MPLHHPPHLCTRTEHQVMNKASIDHRESICLDQRCHPFSLFFFFNSFFCSVFSCTLSFAALAPLISHYPPLGNRLSAFFPLTLSSCVSGVAPTFTSPPSDQTVTDGNTALFTCQTSGAPKPAITWRKGNGPHVLTVTHQAHTHTDTHTMCL